MEEEDNPLLEFLEHFDKLQLEVLAVHVAIHQQLFRIIAHRLGCGRDDLPNLKFMHAVRLAYAGRNHGNVIELLQKLDGVRNVLAHEANASRFTAKFELLCQDCLGVNYDAHPETVEKRRQRDNSALQFVKAVVDSTRAG